MALARRALNGAFKTSRCRLAANAGQSAAANRESLCSPLLVADEGFALLYRCGTQWPETRDAVRQGDHRVWTGILLAVEGRWLGGIKSAGGRIVRIGEPEADVEGMRGQQSARRIETENLIEQDRFDDDSASPLSLAYTSVWYHARPKFLKSGSGSPFASRFEFWIREQVKAQIWLQMVGIQNQRVIELAALHDHFRGWRRFALNAQTGDELRLRNEAKRDFRSGFAGR